MLNLRNSFLALTLVTSGFVSAQETLKTVTLEDVWKKYAFYQQGIEGLQSMADGEHYTSLEPDASGTALVKYRYSDGGKAGTVVTSAQLKEATGEAIKFTDYQFSPDEKKLLLASATEPIFRHSTRSLYHVYDLATGSAKSISDEKLRYATFSPAANQVAYVKGNDLWITDLSSGQARAITADGKENAIINGATDWVYEEEFSFDQAFFWSPGGKYIAYYRFDETSVPEFSMDLYGKELYPRQERFKYPKAGEANAKVTAWIYDVEAKATRQIALPEGYEYIPRIKWSATDEAVIVYTMNRHQNHLQLHRVNPASGAVSLLFEEKDPAYLEISDHCVFLEDGSFIWKSDRDGYLHLYHMGKDGKVKKQITSGTWEVTDFYGYDAKSKTLYFQGNQEGPMYKGVYRVGLNGKGMKALHTLEGNNSADFSSTYSYYVLTNSSSIRPDRIVLNNSQGKEVRVLEDNASLEKRMGGYRISPKQFFMIKTAEGVELSAWKIMPLDMEEGKKYPVLMFVYGGPGSQQVLDTYNGLDFWYYQTLAAKGYMIVCVDNRGTGGRGRDFQKMTYKELGKYETMDQIAAARELAKLPYVDAERIGIWGWSYGGYMSSLCITKGADVFKAAIAVAPVTSWRFYDSIYTERYMQTPQENPGGYDNNSPLFHADRLKGAYLLVHGSGDDNVHVQNTYRMTEALVQANKQFEFFVYPDRNHGIFGGNTRYHLYRMMTDFLEENL